MKRAHALAALALGTASLALAASKGNDAKAEPLSADRPTVLVMGREVAPLAPSADRLRVKWQRSLPVSRLPMAVSEDAITISAQGQLFSLDLETGNDRVHPIRLGAPNAGAPTALLNRTIVVASPSEELLLVRDGEVVSRLPLPSGGSLELPRAAPLADGGFVYGARSRVFLADSSGFVRRTAPLPSTFLTARVAKQDIVIETTDHASYVWRGEGGFAGSPQPLEDARGCTWTGTRCVQAERILRLGRGALEPAFRAPPASVFASGLSRVGGAVLLATSSRLFLLELGDDDKEVRRVPIRPLSGSDGGAIDLNDAVRFLRPVVDRAGNAVFAWETQAIRVTPGGDTQTLELCERADAVLQFLPCAKGIAFLCTRGRVGLLASD